MTPSLETSWVEFERPDVLEAVCLPGILRYECSSRVRCFLNLLRVPCVAPDKKMKKEKGVFSRTAHAGTLFRFQTPRASRPATKLYRSCS